MCVCVCVCVSVLYDYVCLCVCGMYGCVLPVAVVSVELGHWLSGLMYLMCHPDYVTGDFLSTCVDRRLKGSGWGVCVSM